MKVTKKILILLCSALLLAVALTVLGVSAADTAEEPTYVVQLFSGTSTISSLGGNRRVAIGEIIEMPAEGDRLFSTTYLVYPGYTLYGWVVYVGQSSEGENLYYHEGTGLATTINAATVYYSPFADGSERFCDTLRLREGMLINTVLGQRASIYGVWIADTHNIEFCYEDGTPIPASTITGQTAETITLPGIPDGYDQEGMEFMWEYGGVHYGPGAEYTLPAYQDKDRVVSFTAKLIRKQYMYEIVYVTDDGHGNLTEQRGISDSGIANSVTGTVLYDWGTPVSQILSEPAARNGFTFEGWYSDRTCVTPMTDEDAKTASYMPVYAKWVVIPDFTFTVSFEGLTTLRLPYGETFSVPQVPEALLAAHTGYTFGGWSTGAAIYVPGQRMTVSNDTVLTALWDPILHTLTIRVDSESFESSGVAGEEIFIGTRKKNQYTFLGWFDEEGELVCADGNFIMPDRDLVLTARFDPDFYTVFLQNGTQESSVRVSKGSAPALPEGTPGEGRLFLGWYTSDGSAVAAGWIPQSDTTLEARYAEIVYHVTYTNTLNGATYVVDVPYGEREYTPAVPETYAGYRFVQYTDETGAAVTTLSLTGDVTLTAVYAAQTVTVTYRNPYTGEETSETVSVAAPFSPAAPAAPEGYRFVGWRTESGELLNAGTTPAADMTLTAVFEKTGETDGGAPTALKVIAVIVAIIGVAAVALAVTIILVRRKGGVPAQTGKEATDTSEHED